MFSTVHTTISETIITKHTHTHTYELILNSVSAKFCNALFSQCSKGHWENIFDQTNTLKAENGRNNCISVASSRIPTTLLPSGKTPCSLFKISTDLNCNEFPECNIKKKKHERVKLITNSDLTLWDECAMVHKINQRDS